MIFYNTRMVELWFPLEVIRNTELGTTATFTHFDAL
jgi:hypothetical protein